MNTPHQTITRSQALAMLELALQKPETLTAALELALHWLRTYPGDLQVQAAQARILLARGQEQAAQSVAARLCRLDPWDAAFHRLLAQAARRGAPSQAAAANACLQALGVPPIPDLPQPAWGAALAQTRRFLHAGDLQAAQQAFQEALPALNEIPLAGCLHLQLLGAQFPSPDDESHCALPLTPPVRNTLTAYYTRWPDCLPLALWYAEHKLASGQEAQAVAILHHCATRDVGGQVPARLWGEEHPYRSLWPQEIRLPLEIALPAALSALLGWNQLPGEKASPFGEAAAAPPIAESSPKRAGKPGRRAFPLRWRGPGRTSKGVYVLLTTQSGLAAQYGAAQARRVLSALQRLQHTLQAHFQGGALLLVPDSPENMARFDLQPAAPQDAWGIKLALQDLNRQLQRRGRHIGALLIIGGAQVVPFHHLPDPVADDDPHVPSDAPYASNDADFFAAAWPVGRLPGDASARASVLIAQISALQSRYLHPTSRGAQMWAWLRQLGRLLLPAPLEQPPALGYTAAVWWRAAVEVMRPIGSATDLLASPPVVAATLNHQGSAQARLGYFNLHGRQDAAEWFGQCDPRRECAEEYPVALRPADIARLGAVPSVVFSEACYGAHLEGREAEESLALQFLAHGTQALVGSTTLSYGTLSEQLIAADLLGERFWRALQRGLTAGEALQQARLAMAATLKQRQGVLDAEDRKTLISFILLGDPMARVFQPLRVPAVKGARQALQVPLLQDGAALQTPLSEETVAQVKQMMRQYLPGMRGAEWSLHSEQGQVQPKGGAGRPPRRKVLIFRKALPGASQRQYVRVTLDERERVTRLAVSR